MRLREGEVGSLGPSGGMGGGVGFHVVCTILSFHGAGRGWRHCPLLCIVRRSVSDGGQAGGMG
jgi:hypothetical protein